MYDNISNSLDTACL